jgi:2-isopropylmalate synthase
MLKERSTYEIMRPQDVGVPSTDLVLGKHSGRHALEQRYKELGHELDEHRLKQLYTEFTALADKKREILDEDLLALLHGSFHDAPEEYALTELRVVCGSGSADATVRMTGPWIGERKAAGRGDGPIAAAFSAISEILERPVEVINLNLRSVTPGRDSVGQVFLQCRIGGKSLSGQGASTDIVEASGRALVHALNKERHAERLESTAYNETASWGV